LFQYFFIAHSAQSNGFPICQPFPLSCLECGNRPLPSLPFGIPTEGKIVRVFWQVVFATDMMHENHTRPRFNSEKKAFAGVDVRGRASRIFRTYLSRCDLRRDAPEDLTVPRDYIALSTNECFIDFPQSR